MCVRPSRLADGGRFPCGQCVECRLKYSREWGLRAVHEASGHDENCMVDLTYADEFLPRHGSLDVKAPVLFLKRLRKSIEPKKVRYMYAGEYGEDNGRPHYHFILFGHDFVDKVDTGRKSAKGFPLFGSAALSKLWTFGLSNVGQMSFESAAYIARYIMKKSTGKKAHKYNVDAGTGELIEIEREFFRMSTGSRKGEHGLGFDWFERWYKDVYHHDGCSLRGRMVKPPRRYDEWLRLRDAAALEVCKARRERKYGDPKKLYEEFSTRAAREIIAVSNLQRVERGL